MPSAAANGIEAASLARLATQAMTLLPVPKAF